ncbi:MAG TPA: endonuclease/exonuclease/phosphatase family protein [Opitutaceae bacterium]|nr:endonuclease/exonuclease/phosphatase family protein [Opitutaceae bacterium]
MVQFFSLLASDFVRERTGTPRGLIVALLITAALSVECAAGSLTVATWNVENYLPAARRVDGVFRPGYPKPEAEKSALRDVIRATAADVIAFQEMGDESQLVELQRDLARDGIDYLHSAWLAAADTERHVAVLSKVPFVRIERHGHLPVRFLGADDFVKRGVLEVVVMSGEDEITLFVIHLKSRFTERRDDPGSAIQRAAEAVAIRDLVLDRFPDPAVARFMIAGDFNDTRDTRPLRAMMKRGDTTIARILPAADDRGDAWTHRYRRKESYSRVDFILVSPGLEAWAKALAIRVVDTPRVRNASDHRPVVLTLEWE